MEPNFWTHYAVAETRKGNYLVVRFGGFGDGLEPAEKGTLQSPTLWVLSALDGNADPDIPRGVLREAIKRLGVVVQELDI